MKTLIWKSKITEITGIKYPIVMGAFAFLGKAEFAAAFSNAGGLGIISALNFKNSSDFESDLKKMNDLTDKPYGVNFSIMPPEILDKTGKGRSEESYLGFVDIAINAGVKVCTTSGYQANKIGKKLKDGNCHWFHKCTIINHAVSAEKMGADAVTLVGLEGVGHKNPLQNTTLINITMARKTLNIPIIAAGGIGDARGFLAALAMGADAVCFGSAIIATSESPASENWKNQIIHQDIFEEDFYNNIFHFQFDTSRFPIGSMAIGHCDKIISIKEFIEDKIVKNAEEILAKWNFNSNEFCSY